MKVIIAGSRTIKDIKLIEDAICESGWFLEINEVVSGGQKSWDQETGLWIGADWLGEVWAIQHFIIVKSFNADWKFLGRKAGPIRNQQMADYADALIAIWDGKSRGTKDMIDRATKKGLKVYVKRVD